MRYRLLLIGTAGTQDLPIVQTIEFDSKQEADIAEELISKARIQGLLLTVIKLYGSSHG
jgi:hypothetical protein